MVFVCDFFREPTDDKPYKQVFFTNRLEYGHSSVYRKLEAIHTTLQASNQSQLNEAEKKFNLTQKCQSLEMVVQASENEGSLLFDNFDQSVRVTLQVKRMDYNGKEYVTDGSLEPYECTLAYLKLINVPTMFDITSLNIFIYSYTHNNIGCTQSDPSTDFLTLNMIDDKTFKIENQDFLNSNQKLKKTKVKKQRGALQAIHTNLFVSEVTIIPHAIVKDSIQQQNNFNSQLMILNKSYPLYLYVMTQLQVVIIIARIQINRMVINEVNLNLKLDLDRILETPNNNYMAMKIAAFIFLIIIVSPMNIQI